jgi:archaellum biogenesis protein FlaJ (TadC family)
MSNQYSHEKIIQLRKKRSAADRRFKTYGLIATLMGMAILFFLLFTIFSKGYSSFQKSVIELEVSYDQETLKITSDSTYEEQVKAKFFRVKKKCHCQCITKPK